MKSRFVLRCREHLGSPDRKRFYTGQVFAEVAPSYPFLTRALSLGRDRAWKRFMTSLLPSFCKGLCVDLACGTGDISLLLAGRYPEATLVGLDLVPEMLEAARARDASGRVRFVQADVGALCFADGSVDIVTGGYALRNAPDLVTALRETRRVLTQGGRAVFLEFSRSGSAWKDRIQFALLKAWGGLWGWILHRNPDVYGYIAESLRAFPDRQELPGLLAAAGLRLDARRAFFLGILEVILVTAV